MVLLRLFHWDAEKGLFVKRRGARLGQFVISRALTRDYFLIWVKILFGPGARVLEVSSLTKGSHLNPTPPGSWFPWDALPSK